MVVEKQTISRPLINGGGHRGPTTIDLGNGFSADTYSKSPYIAEKDYLVQITEGLVARANLWIPDVARDRILDISKKSDPKNTSWIGFRNADAPIGQYDGCAWQDMLYIPTVRGDIALLFMRLRVFAPEAQRLHLGRSSMQIALNTHSEAEPVYIGHRTGSPAAVRSWLEADIFRLRRRFPYDLPYENDFVASMLLMNIYELTHINGRIPNRSTGVSVGEYAESNRAYIPDPTHEPTMRILEWMTGKLKMKPGDALTEIGELR